MQEEHLFQFKPDKHKGNNNDNNNNNNNNNKNSSQLNLLHTCTIFAEAEIFRNATNVQQ